MIRLREHQLRIVDKMNLISDALKIELKELINEVLDERDIEKKMNGPYDFPEDLL